MFLLGKAKERMEKEERGGQEAENERAVGDREGERSRAHFPRQHSGAVFLTRRGSSHKVFIMTFCK